MIRVYLLASLASLLGVIGDVLGTEAARGRHPRIFVALSAFCWALCAPVWFHLSRATNGGFTRPGAMWGMVSSALWAALSLSPWGEPEPRYKMALVIAMLAIVVAREI